MSAWYTAPRSLLAVSHSVFLKSEFMFCSYPAKVTDTVQDHYIAELNEHAGPTRITDLYTFKPVEIDASYHLTNAISMAFTEQNGWSRLDLAHLNTCEHYYNEKLNRWKCKACLRYFWPLPDTIFHDAKMEPQEIMATAFLWLTDAGGSPALTVRKQTGKAYLTTSTTLAKIREGLIKGFNVGFISGEIEMDASHQSGRRSAAKYPSVKSCVFDFGS